MPGRGGMSLAKETACAKVLRQQRAYYCQGKERIASVAGAERAKRREAGGKFGEIGRGILF